MKVFKAFTKPYEAPQGSVNIKFNFIFSLRPGLEREGLNPDQLLIRDIHQRHRKSGSIDYTSLNARTLDIYQVFMDIYQVFQNEIP